MKKILICFIAGIAVVSHCHGAIQTKTTDASNDALNSLQNEIRILENELNSKTEKLNKCTQKNKNFKISGITAVGLAGAGAATNISLNSKIKNQKKSVENMADKIKTSNNQIEYFTKEIEELYHNMDVQKFSQELQSSLTDSEKQRWAELTNNYFENFSDDEPISESDKVLLLKIISAARKSQK